MCAGPRMAETVYALQVSSACVSRFDRRRGAGDVLPPVGLEELTRDHARFAKTIPKED
jgi:hypothetical protein